MGSVSSMNPGLTQLFQTLSNVNSPVLSSPAMVTALQSASPNDIVQLSLAANQLEDVDAIFGISNGSSNTLDTSMNNLLAALEPSMTGAATPGSGTSPTTAAPASTATTTGSPADQMANYQAVSQMAETEALLGDPSTGGLSGPLFNVLG